MRLVTKKNLRAAVVGVGYLGQFHAEKLAAAPGVELVAVVDSDAARARTIAAKHGCRALTGPGGLAGEVDLASIAVPTEQHHAAALPFLEAGVHVLVEKPIATTLAQADAMIAAAKKSRALLAVGHLQRFNPAFRALAAAFTKPLFIDCERLSGFKQRGIDVDVVLDLMIHDLDLVLALAKAPIEQVSASGFRVLTDAIDIANARVEFADGCIASVSASRVSQSPVRKLRVFRHDEYVSADLQGQRLRHVRKGREGENSGGIVVSEQAFERVDELAAQTAAFLQAVRGHGVPLVSGEQGRQALALALQVGKLVEERLARHGS